MKRNPTLDGFQLLKETLQFDRLSYEITDTETDWLLIRASLLRDICESISSMPEADGKIILVKAGMFVGQNFTKSLLERGMLPNEIPTILNLFLDENGWGKAEINLDEKNRSGVITVKNNVLERQKRAKESNCHLMMGVFKGIFETIFETEMDCSETECLAKGDAVCKFSFQAKKARRKSHKQ